MTDLLRFMDNINFLSENKMKMCTKSCRSKTITGEAKSIGGDGIESYDECMWVCYNKLERRYRDYWKKQKEDIVLRHYNMTYSDLSAKFEEKK